MSNKKQTAVEWLFDNLNLCFDKFDNGEYSYTEFVNASNEIKEQSKAMEKEQIINAAYSNMNAIEEDPIGEAEQYYKETFNNE